MPATLVAVGIKQPIVGGAGDDFPELPRDVGNIANALAHSLPDERRLLMGGIPSEEDSAFTPVLSDESVKAITAGSP
jgi:hypothetical protein